MSTKADLPKIRIASPCSTRWEDMAGDHQCRFCAQCEKHVYNFSSMSAAQVQELIRNREGKVCARIFQRTDGTILTSDCPVGVAGSWRRLKIVVCSATAGIALCIGTLCAFGSFSDSSSRTRNRLERQWDEVVWRIKSWLNLNPPAAVVGEMVMGDICVPTATTNSPASVSTPN